MSKTLERVLTDAVNDGMSRPFFVQFVISRLREAGWLREEPRVGPCGEGAIKRLTRERDEARQGHATYWHTRYIDLLREVVALRAYAASPEVMRVVDHSEAVMRLWDDNTTKPEFVRAMRALGYAVDALSASRQPKAQEPRWTTEVLPHIFGPRGETLYGVNKGGDWFGPLSPSMCHELANRLNGEGGGK